MGTGVLIAVVVVLVLLFAGALVLIWRLYTDSARRADQALRMVEAERARTVEQQAALRRYEVAVASITRWAAACTSRCHASITQPVKSHTACSSLAGSPDATSRDRRNGSRGRPSRLDGTSRRR